MAVRHGQDTKRGARGGGKKLALRDGLHVCFPVLVRFLGAVPTIPNSTEHRLAIRLAPGDFGCSGGSHQRYDNSPERLAPGNCSTHPWRGRILSWLTPVTGARNL